MVTAQSPQAVTESPKQPRKTIVNKQIGSGGMLNVQSYYSTTMNNTSPKLLGSKFFNDFAKTSAAPKARGVGETY